MAPSACLSSVVTLALLLLIAGFALGGHHTLSKKKQQPHAMIARFLPLANDSAAPSPDYRRHHRQSQGHNISARSSRPCSLKDELYKVVVCTTYREEGFTDGKVFIRFGGYLCMTGWNKLYHLLVSDFEKGDKTDFKFYNYNIGSKITEVYIYFEYPLIKEDWHLEKIDTYYKSVKKTFYWNDWVPGNKEVKLKKTASPVVHTATATARARASMTTVVVFVLTTWFLI